MPDIDREPFASLLIAILHARSTALGPVRSFFVDDPGRFAWNDLSAFPAGVVIVSQDPPQSVRGFVAIEWAQSRLALFIYNTNEGCFEGRGEFEQAADGCLNVVLSPSEMDELKRVVWPPMVKGSGVEAYLRLTTRR